MSTKKSSNTKKKASTKGKSAPKPAISPVLKEAVKKVKALKKETGHFSAAGVPAAPCLPLQTATGIVFSCLGKAVALHVTLGQLYPNDNARGAFCRCVFMSARHSGIEKPVIPCVKTTTVGAVIQSIAC